MTLYRHATLAAVVVLGLAAPASAQRYAFERSFDTAAAVTLDASTIRGKITVATGPAGRVVVRGTVTVRIGFDTPLNTVDLAQKLAANPPVTRDADRIQLRPPTNDNERRAVTIAYDVIVPVETHVVANSDSGALSITGVHGQLTARTQSGALDFLNLGGQSDISTGSGAVKVDGTGGPTTITTSSSAINATSVRSDLRVKTQSGAVAIESRGPGDLEIATGSSEITVTGAAHGVRATSQSGRIRIDGRPGAPWLVSSGSGALDVMLNSGAAATIDANTRSGSIRIRDLEVTGTQARQRVHGTVGAGGPTVTLTAGNGSIDLRGH